MSTVQAQGYVGDNILDDLILPFQAPDPCPGHQQHHNDESVSPKLESPREAGTALPDFGDAVVAASNTSMGIDALDFGDRPWMMPDLSGEADLSEQAFTSPFESQGECRLDR